MKNKPQNIFGMYGTLYESADKQMLNILSTEMYRGLKNYLLDEIENQIYDSITLLTMEQAYQEVVR